VLHSVLKASTRTLPGVCARTLPEILGVARGHGLHVGASGLAARLVAPVARQGWWDGGEGEGEGEGKGEYAKGDGAGKGGRGEKRRAKEIPSKLNIDQYK